MSLSASAHRIAIGAAFVLLLLFGVAFFGCGRSPGHVGKASATSVSSMLDRLPNLRAFGVLTCSYTVEKSTKRSGVPSPSDTKIEMTGSAELSEDGFKAIRSRFTWKTVARDAVPEALLAVVPGGELLFSRELNETFADNPRSFAHGFVVILADEKSRSIFFLTGDGDHPIE